MLMFIWNLLAFVVALGILVTVHEYGHYWVAKRCGVTVERFSIGFGKPIWRKHNKAGTEFVIALIPLGGYVKMLDERVDNVPSYLRHTAFNQKNVYQRIAIIAAGPLANFLFAIFAFYLMFLIGLPSVKPIIGDIAPSSIAEQAGLPKKSQIITVNGVETQDLNSVNLALVAQIGEPSITIEAKLPDSVSSKRFTLNTTQWQFEPSSESALDSLGIIAYRPQIEPVIAQVSKDSAAEKAGILVGDTIVSIDNVGIKSNWQTLVDVVQQKPNQLVNMVILRNNQEINIEVLADSRKLANGTEVGVLGVFPTLSPWPKEYLMELSYGPIDAIWYGAQRTWDMVALSFNMIAKLVTGDLSLNNLSGPIGIAQSAGDSAGYGLVYFLSFLALISINLGIINLLPLPVLDGGHLVYYLIELFTGKAVPQKVQEIGFKVGALMLFALMSVAIFNDLSRL